jgi:hypothetical protein
MQRRVDGKLIMAEAVAIVSLLASILQLVDFGTRLLDRLKDFSSNLQDVPETFRTISVQFRLALSTLRTVQEQAKRGEFSEAEAEALQPVVDRSLQLMKDVNLILERVVPSANASSLERRLQAFRSIKYDKKVHSANIQLLQNLHVLAFHQATHNTELTKELSMAMSKPTESFFPPDQNFDHGLSLGSAPQLVEGAFIGRQSELTELRKMLDPVSQRQNIVAVSAMGGMGKTQLCIEFGVQQQADYSSIFWLNAKDELSLRNDLIVMSQTILPGQARPASSKDEEDETIRNVRQWLSHAGNRRWLLIFDNLDHPKLPGTKDSEAYDIKQYFPFR